MSMITVRDGTELYFKNWGKGNPLFLTMRIA
jgi:hypothetical protein